jgi:hypothetical protein
VSVLRLLSLLIFWVLLASTGLILSLMKTNPLAIGPLGVTLWFVILFWDVAALIALALFAAKSFMHVHAAAPSRLRYSWRQGLLVGGWVTGLLALSSLHQLGVLDAILLALLLGIVEVYVRFRWP